MESEWVSFPLFAIIATGDVDSLLETSGMSASLLGGQHAPAHATSSVTQVDGTSASTTVADPATATCASARTTAALTGETRDHSRRFSGMAAIASGEQMLHSGLQIPIQHLS